MGLFPIEAEEEDTRQARKHILRYALLKEDNRTQRNMDQRHKENQAERQRNGTDIAELKFRTRNLFSLCC